VCPRPRASGRSERRTSRTSAEGGVDLGFSNADGAQRTTDLRRSGVTRDVGAFGSDPEHGFHRQPARLHIYLVVRQQQRPVDVEQHEPAQTATTESTASRSERT
jgi:hypothetical protein